jgi:hypothetical protein
MNATSQGSPVVRWGRAKIVEIFGADLRSLAAFRIMLALLVLADLANRHTDLYAHYTDRGILPRGVLLEEVLNPWLFSLNLMNGEPFFQKLLFGIAALAALALLVGYRTRLMTVIVWVMLLSIQWRNPLVLNAGDILLRMLLFWGMFLPLGAYWSVDRTLKTQVPRLSMHFLSLGTVGLFMQIAFVYWFTAMPKSGEEWRVDGTAIYYALSIDQIVTPIGAYLSHFPTLLKVLTFATILLEAFGPFLLFFPLFTGLVRTGTILAFMSLHFGIWLTMSIGIFPWTSAFCMVCFLPNWFWDKTAAMWRAAFPEQPDIARRLQHAAARLVQAYWSPLRAKVLSTAGMGQPSVAGMAVHSDADPSPPRAPATKEPHHDQARRADEITVERQVQHHATAGAEPRTLRSSLATNVLALLFLLYVFLWNLTTISAFTMPERVVPLGSFLGLNQSWGMFAPSPAKNDGWYVIPGTLRDGQQVDLMPAFTHYDFRVGKEVSWEKPRYVPGTLRNEHWRKYMERIREEEYTDQRQHFGRYICREWNARHADTEQLLDLQIIFMEETTLPNYQLSTPQKVVLGEHSCF